MVISHIEAASQNERFFQKIISIVNKFRGVKYTKIYRNQFI